MNVEISWLGVILATISAMVVGAVWYAKPVMGKQWQELVGLKEEDMNAKAATSLTIALVLSFVTAYVVAHVTELSHAFYQNSYVQDGVTTAFWLWLGIAMTTIVVHGTFEQRRRKLLAMTAVNQLVTLLLMGLLYGLVR